MRARLESTGEGVLFRDFITGNIEQSLIHLIVDHLDCIRRCAYILETFDDWRALLDIDQLTVLIEIESALGCIFAGREVLDIIGDSVFLPRLRCAVCLMRVSPDIAVQAVQSLDIILEVRA